MTTASFALLAQLADPLKRGWLLFDDERQALAAFLAERDRLLADRARVAETLGTLSLLPETPSGIASALGTIARMLIQ